MKKVSLFLVLISLFVLSLSISVTASNYREAYRKEINKFEKEKHSSGTSCKYNLIYIDKDSKPELVCHSYPKSLGIRYLGYMRIYTFYNGSARCLFNDTVYNTPYRCGIHYKPKKNSVFFRTSTDYVTDIFSEIKNGKLVDVKSKSYTKSSIGETPPMNVWDKYKVKIDGKYSKKKILSKLK